MNTARTPAPSTANLVAGSLGGNANLARLAMNQASLEHAGHLNPTPMTAKGLSDMRQAISSQVNRMGQSEKPLSQDVPMTMLLTKLGPDIAGIAQTLIEKARSLAAELTRATKLIPAVAPTRSVTAPALAHSNTIAREYMSQSAAKLQDRRRQHDSLKMHSTPQAI